MTLEDRLREILRATFQRIVREAIEKHGESIVEFAERSKNIREESIEQIIQAFKDDGWYRPQDSIYGPIKRMTGQEWYERFEKELRLVINSHPNPYNLLVTSRVLKAAKRASGIEEKSDE